MRVLSPWCHVVLVALVALPAACSDGASTVLPSSDGYGPAGGGAQQGSTSSGSSGGGSTTPPSSSGGSGSSGSSGSSSGATSPPPPPPDDDAGSDAGTGWTGRDAGGWSEGGGSDGGTTSGDAGDVSALLTLCAGQVNDFRVQNGVDIVEEATDLESYAAAAAASDALSGQAHGYFDSTNGGGVASTEDELDGARFDPGANAEQTMEQGLQDDEDSNGQAAANLLDQQFNSIGCGFAQDSTGNWWVVVALR